MSSYLGNAVILTGSGLLLRAAGMGLRVYMAGLLGSEGMGLYQLIFTMYGLSIALATSGVSVAAAHAEPLYFISVTVFAVWSILYQNAPDAGLDGAGAEIGPINASTSC